MRRLTLLFLLTALTVLLAVVLAPPMKAADAPPSPAGSPGDWGIPASLTGLGGAVLWGARMVGKTIERSSKRSDDQITRLCKVAHDAIDVARENGERMEDARRTLVAVANLPSDTTIRPRPREDHRSHRTADGIGEPLARGT